MVWWLLAVKTGKLSRGGAAVGCGAKRSMPPGAASAPLGVARRRVSLRAVSVAPQRSFGESRQLLIRLNAAGAQRSPSTGERPRHRLIQVTARFRTTAVGPNAGCWACVRPQRHLFGAAHQSRSGAERLSVCNASCGSNRDTPQTPFAAAPQRPRKMKRGLRCARASARARVVCAQRNIGGVQLGGCALTWQRTRDVRSSWMYARRDLVGRYCSPPSP